MSQVGTDLLDTLRQPAHTGANRCWPCTILNGAIAVAASLLIAIRSSELGGAVLVVSAAVIYARGYLVPGTPRIASQLPLLRRIHADDRASPARLDEALDLLNEKGVVTETDENVGLTREFKNEWARRIDELSVEDVGVAELSSTIGIPADRLSINDGNPFISFPEEYRTVQWGTPETLVADVAGGEALHERISQWDELEWVVREQLVRGIRPFVPRCPRCGADVAVAAKPVDSCCLPIEVQQASCVECDASLSSFDYHTHVDPPYESG